MGFQYYRAPPQIEVILYLLFDTLWHQRITNCFGWEKEPCPNALSAQANDHKPDHNKRLSFCWGEADHSADRESVYNAHSSHRYCRSTQVRMQQLLGNVVAQEWSTLVEERVARAIRSGTTCPRQQHWASLSLNNGLRPSAPGDCQVPPIANHPSTSCSNFVRN